MTLYLFRCLNCEARVPSTNIHHSAPHICNKTPTSTTYGVLQYIGTTEQTIATPPPPAPVITKKLSHKRNK